MTTVRGWVNCCRVRRTPDQHLDERPGQATGNYGPGWSGSAEVRRERVGQIVRIVDATHLPSRMHGKKGYAHIHADYAEPCCCQWPGCRSARDHIVRDESLTRDPGDITNPLPQSRTDGIAGVPLLAVHFQHGATVHHGPMGRIVQLGMIGMDGVPSVGRDARTCRQHPVEALVSHALTGRDPDQGVLQKWSRSSCAGGTANFLVIEAGENRDVTALLGSQHRCESGMDADQVVEPASGEELVVDAEDHGFLIAVQHQIVPGDVFNRHLDLVGQGRHDVARTSQATDRQQVLLLVKHESFVDRAVEVWR